VYAIPTQTASSASKVYQILTSTEREYRFRIAVAAENRNMARIEREMTANIKV
jgi:hypothetical protein